MSINLTTRFAFAAFLIASSPCWAGQIIYSDTADSACAQDVKPNPSQTSWYCRNVDATIDAEQQKSASYHPHISVPSGYQFCGYKFSRVYTNSGYLGVSAFQGHGLTLDMDAYKPSGKATPSIWARGFKPGTTDVIAGTFCASQGWHMNQPPQGIVHADPDPTAGPPVIPQCVGVALLCNGIPCGVCTPSIPN